MVERARQQRRPRLHQPFDRAHDLAPVRQVGVRFRPAEIEHRSLDRDRRDCLIPSPHRQRERGAPARESGLLDRESPLADGLEIAVERLLLRHALAVRPPPSLNRRAAPSGGELVTSLVPGAAAMRTPYQPSRTVSEAVSPLAKASWRRYGMQI